MPYIPLIQYAEFSATIHHFEVELNEKQFSKLPRLVIFHLDYDTIPHCKTVTRE